MLSIETCDGGCRQYPTLPRIRKQSVLGGARNIATDYTGQAADVTRLVSNLDAKMAKSAKRAKEVRPISKPAAGGLTGAVVGGLVGGPVGAVMGGLAGAVVGSAAEGKKPMKNGRAKAALGGKTSWSEAIWQEEWRCGAATSQEIVAQEGQGGRKGWHVVRDRAKKEIRPQGQER